MGVYLEIEDLDQLFRNSSGAIVINDLGTVTTEQRDFLDRLTHVEYSADTISTIPRCDCGATTDGFKIGTICPECGTPVQEVFAQAIEPIAWIRAPIGIPGLINPAILSLLNDTFVCGAGRESNKFPYFAWLINPSITPKTAYERMVCESITQSGLQRGYINFVNNFDTYVDKLFKDIRIPTLSAGKKPTTKPMKVIDLTNPVFKYLVPYFQHDTPELEVHPVHAVIRLYRKLAICQHIPLPNKALLILEKTHYGTYADGPVTELIDTIKTIVGIDTPLSRVNDQQHTDFLSEIDPHSARELESLSLRQIEHRTVKTLFKISDYHVSTQKEILSRKEGLFRKHNYGTRVCWSMRCVISSITKAHKYDEIHVPWSASIAMFTMHLQNKLLRRGMTPNESREFIQAHMHRYNKLIDELFQELLHEAPGGRIAVFINRNEIGT